MKWLRNIFDVSTPKIDNLQMAKKTTSNSDSRPCPPMTRQSSEDLDNEVDRVLANRFTKFWWMEDSDPKVEASRYAALHRETEENLQTQILHGGGIGWMI